MDASNFRGSVPASVRTPKTEDEVGIILSTCKGPVVIAGAGTGTVGGCVPVVDQTLVLLMANLQSIQLAERGQFAGSVVWAQSGVPLQRLNLWLSERGFWFPVNPTESLASIGGMVSTNASGGRSFRHGSVRSWVTALKGYWSNGDRFELYRDDPAKCTGIQPIPTVTQLSSRHPKATCGYVCDQNSDLPNKLIDLLIGSEGTLGVVTQIGLKLLAKPKNHLSSLLLLADFEGALQLARQIIANKKEHVTTLDFLDHQSLALGFDSLEWLPPGSVGVYLEHFGELDSNVIWAAWNSYLDSSKARWFPDSSIIAISDRDQERLASIRHRIPMAMNERFREAGLTKLALDAAVPIGPARRVLRAAASNPGRYHPLSIWAFGGRTLTREHSA